MIGVVAACSSVPVEELAGLVPTTTAQAADVSSTTVRPAVPTSTIAADADLEGLAGRLAVGGLPALEIWTPAGAVSAAHPGTGAAITQPTWSREGDAVIATMLTPPTGEVMVSRDGAVSRSQARRPYFFYSWSPTGSFVAALGPGPEGTTLDILGPDGSPVTDDTLSTGSFFLAWEPGGDELVIHRNRRLELVRDPTDPTILEFLGEPGESFLAPAWIPGTREILVVEEDPGGNRLVRLNVDTTVRADLGPVDGTVGIVVSPNGDRALLAHGSASAGGDLAIALRSVVEVVSPTEIVDLASGERQPVNEQRSLWAEWSPDGSRLALLQPNGSDAVEWVVWDGASTRGLGRFLPGPIFFRDYLLYSWQFTESPRVWSPDSTALVYAGFADGREGIWVDRIDDDAPALRVGDGTVAFWSPD